MLKTFFVLMSFICLNLVHAEQITWSTPEVISNSSAKASDVQLIMGLDGEATAMWIENGLVIAKSKPLLLPWSTATTLSNSDSSQPKLRKDTYGNVTACWVERGVLRTAYKPQGNKWLSAEDLSLVGVVEYDLAVDQNSGDTFAVWSIEGALFAKNRPYGKEWDSVVETGFGTSTNIIKAAFTGSVKAIAWEGEEQGIKIIFSTVNIGDSGWGRPYALSDLAQHAGNPWIDVSPQGDVCVVWYGYEVIEHGCRKVTAQVDRKPHGLPWLNPVIISSEGLMDPSLLKVLCSYDPYGNLLLAWTNSPDGATFTFEECVRTAEGLSLGPTQLAANNLYLLDFDTTMSLQENIYFALMYYDENIAKTAISVLGAASPTIDQPKWIKQGDVIDGANNAFPNIGVHADSTMNHIVMVWVNGDNSNISIVAVTGTDPIVPPVTNLSAEQLTNDFGVFTETYNKLTWTQSTSENLNHYTIHRNGIQMDTLSPDEKEYIDHNQKPGIAEYKIYAIDDDGCASLQATVQAAPPGE